MVKETINRSEINRKAYQTAEALEEYSHYFLFPQERHLFSKYYKPEERILDLACGAARTTLFLHEMGCKPKGVDISDLLIESAKRRFPYLELTIGSYCQIEADDQSFDHVLISFNGLDYAYPEEQRVRALQECSRVLRRGGTLIFSSHNIRSLHCSPYYFVDGWGRIFWKLKNSLKAFKTKDYVLDLGMYTHYCSPQHVIQHTEEHGLRFVEMVGFRLSRSHILNAYISPWIYYVFIK